MQEEMQHDCKLCSENKLKPCLFMTLKSILAKVFTNSGTYDNKSFKSRKSVSYLCLNKIKSNKFFLKFCIKPKLQFPGRNIRA